MAFIKYEEAPGLSASTDNILRIHGINPKVLRGHVALYHAVMHAESPLSLAQREMLAVAVSASNGCRY